jgi:hypothetical protein
MPQHVIAPSGKDRTYGQGQSLLICDVRVTSVHPQSQKCASFGNRVRDANGQALAFLYCEDEPGRRTTATCWPATRRGASRPISPSCRAAAKGPNSVAVVFGTVLVAALTANAAGVLLLARSAENQYDRLPLLGDDLIRRHADTRCRHSAPRQTRPP